MTEVNNKITPSLSTYNKEIIQYIPYLLQDLWEFGSNVEEIIKLIRENIPRNRIKKALDLATGKGAIAIKVAKSCSFHIKGIDIFPEFIHYAIEKAEKYKVNGLVNFEINDINKSIEIERGYELVIFASTRKIIEQPMDMLQKLKKIISDKGYIILSNTYSIDDIICPTRANWHKYFKESGLKIIAEIFQNENKTISVNRANLDNIINRAEELIKKYPERKKLFKSYIKQQEEECDLLENEITGVSWLLQII